MLKSICHISLWVNIYVITVQGLKRRLPNDDGTDRRLIAPVVISEFLRRKAIIETIVIARNTAILIYISLLRLLPLW